MPVAHEAQGVGPQLIAQNPDDVWELSAGGPVGGLIGCGVAMLPWLAHVAGTFPKVPPANAPSCVGIDSSRRPLGCKLGRHKGKRALAGRRMGLVLQPRLDVGGTRHKNRGCPLTGCPPADDGRCEGGDP